MKSDDMWQHPFVDVFKFININEWRVAKKEGEVLEVVDKAIGKKTFRISGAISAANYIQIPRPKSQLKSLSLTGRFCYVEVQIPKDKLYSMHFEFVLENKNTGTKEILRISLSNLFKESKIISSGLQLACHLSDKWTIILLDIKALLWQHFGNLYRKFTLKSFNLCSSMIIRGVFTSDILYTQNNLPRDMSFKTDRNKAWNELYDWVEFPNENERENIEFEITEQETEFMEIEYIETEKSEKSEEIKQKQAEIIEKKVVDEGKKKQEEIPHKYEEVTLKFDQKVVKTDEKPKKFNVQFHEYSEFKPKEEIKAPDSSLRQKYEKSLDSFNISKDMIPTSEYQRRSPSKERESLEVSKEDLSFNLTKTPNKYETPARREEPKPKGVMHPDPIMSLSYIIGFSGNKPNTVKWSRPKSNFSCYPPEFIQNSHNKFLIYPSGCTLIFMNPITRKQQFFFGHTAPISCLAVSTDGTLVATGQEGANPLVLVWEIKTRRAPTQIALQKTLSVTAVDISFDSNNLVIASVDNLKRDIVTVYDISNINQEIKGKQAINQEVKMKAKHVSNFHINTIKFSPIDSTLLMSCGKENIRQWKINKDHLTGTIVVLKQHARGAEFLDLSFEIFSPADAEHSKRVFVGSSQGLLFQVNYFTLELEGILQLHASGIQSITVGEQFCCIGSQDCYLRVWPLDFSEYSFEVNNESTIMGVDISADNLQIACGTANSTLRVLDMSNNMIKTLIWGHTSQIVNFDIHPSNGTLVTASIDCTIRVWSLETFEEQYEFTSSGDVPMSVSYHPEENFFACGFESGMVRIFEVESTRERDEFLQHDCKCIKVVHSGDGNLLLSASEDAMVCLYDVRRKYQPVKSIFPEIPGDHVDVCFSHDSKHFAVLGTQGSTIFIWECSTFSQKFRINTLGAIIHKIVFSPNGQDIIAINSAQEFRVRYYGLNGFEAIPIKELQGLHPNSEILSFSISNNSKYLVTGGTDRILKIWDYSSKPNSISGQAFIGHSFNISNIGWSIDRNYLISSSQGPDGIFIWKFFGDKTPLELPPPPQTKPEAVKIIDEESYDDIRATVQLIPKIENTDNLGLSYERSVGILPKIAEEGVLEAKRPISTSLFQKKNSPSSLKK
ncbi:unnamed protein product [Blepharisma stoltei]|uniref:Uncharacterized protein n=1 Tax=Blepharisma stoltei TaxID=1481888 RepID=A0AAU9KC39_9CILI|nr:unnamed protein product [Blepharisma stoltei]